MTNKYVYVPSIILALIFITIYGYRCWKDKKHFSLHKAVCMCTFAPGIVGGVFLIAGTIFEPIKEIIYEDKFYVFVGGVAVIAVSVIGVWDDLFKPYRLKTSNDQHVAIDEEIIT